MAHGLDTVETEPDLAPALAAANPAERVVGAINRVVVVLSSIALVIASGVLTYSVVVRYFLKYSTDWQDEMSVFLVLGAVFMSAAAIQAQRHHVGIEVIDSLLPKSVNQTRVLLIDIASLAFCAYFAWKSYALLREAIEDNYHSSSTWGPPLWIPYSLMTAGMVLLSVQLLLQVAAPARALSTAAVLRAAIALVAVAAVGLLAERLNFTALLGSVVDVNSVAFIGLLYGIITLIVMFAGMPIAFALGAVATVFMIAYMPRGSVDSAVHPQGLGHWPLARRPGPLRRAACMDASHPRRPRHRQRVRLRTFRGNGWLLSGDLLSDRLGRNSGDAQARLFQRVRSGHHRGGRHIGDPAATVDHDDSLRGRGRAVAGPALSRRDWARAAAGRTLRRLCDVAVPPRIPRRETGLRGDGEAIRAAAPGRHVLPRQICAAASRHSVRDLADRRDGRTLWRLRHAVGDRGPWRRAGADPHCNDLQRLEAARARADPRLHPEGIDDADVHHRHVAALFVRDELSPHQPVDRGVDRLPASIALGAVVRDPGDGGGSRILSPSGIHHSHDRADHPAAAASRSIRPHLVRRDHDDRDGDGSHSPPGRIEHFRHKKHRARYFAARRNLGRRALRRVDGHRGRDLVHLS